MRDIIPLSLPTVFVAQTSFDGWERMGIVGLSIAATTFIFGYFSKRDSETQKKLEADRAANQARDAEERNRLMERANALQEQVVDLLKAQLHSTHRTIDNSPDHPIPVKRHD